MKRMLILGLVLFALVVLAGPTFAEHGNIGGIGAGITTHSIHLIR